VIVVAAAEWRACSLEFGAHLEHLAKMEYLDADRGPVTAHDLTDDALHNARVRITAELHAATQLRPPKCERATAGKRRYLREVEACIELRGRLVERYGATEQGTHRWTKWQQGHAPHYRLALTVDHDRYHRGGNPVLNWSRCSCQDGFAVAARHGRGGGARV
jgi:hypothetical protein